MVDDLKDSERQELEELRALIDLQHTRTLEADELWRRAHPGNELVLPDLGELVGWLMREATRARLLVRLVLQLRCAHSGPGGPESDCPVCVAREIGEAMDIPIPGRRPVEQ